MEATLVRRTIAELVGTALLVLFGAGSVVAANQQGGGAVTYAGLGIISLSFALVVALVIYTFGTTSGAHINPAVTLALASTGRFPWTEVPAYLVAQMVGAFGGGLLIVGVVGDRAADPELGRVGLTATGVGVDSWQAVLAEGLGTLLLLLTIMALAVDKRAPTGWAGFLIGLAVACEIMVIGPFTGGSVNPARTFGPYLTTDVFGGSTPWDQYWIYVVGPVAGAVVAAVLYDQLVRPGRAVPAPVGPRPEEAVPTAPGRQRAGEPAGEGVPAQPSGRHHVPGGQVPGDAYAPGDREPRRDT